MPALADAQNPQHNSMCFTGRAVHPDLCRRFTASSIENCDSVAGLCAKNMEQMMLLFRAEKQIRFIPVGGIYITPVHDFIR